jgi:hypothetical protein
MKKNHIIINPLHYQHNTKAIERTQLCLKT